eukprot:6238266-Amphidinium_carterae.2
MPLPFASRSLTLCVDEVRNFTRLGPQGTPTNHLHGSAPKRLKSFNNSVPQKLDTPGDMY